MLQLASANSLPGPSGNCWLQAGSPEQSSAAVKTTHDLVDMDTFLRFSLSVAQFYCGRHVVRKSQRVNWGRPPAADPSAATRKMRRERMGKRAESAARPPTRT